MRGPLLHVARQPRLHLSMCADEPVDELVFYGDAAWLFAYGAVQGIVDLLPSVFTLDEASADSTIFSIDLPLENPVAQGSLLALTWIVLTRAIGGYSYTRTRVMPDALFYTAASWLASCVLLIGGLALLGSLGIGPGASQTEVNFITGSATVVGGWRLVCATSLQ